MLELAKDFGRTEGISVTSWPNKDWFGCSLAEQTIRRLSLKEFGHLMAEQRLLRLCNGRTKDQEQNKVDLG